MVDMNPRSRLIHTALNKPTDRGVVWPDRYWEETLERWRCEGYSGDMDFGYDFNEEASHSATGIVYGYCPAFENKVLEDEGDTQIILDEYGVKKRRRKTGTSMPQFLTFPVTDRESFEQIKWRLNPDSPERYPDDMIAMAKEANAQTHTPVTLGGGHLCGFFSFTRELFGDELYYAIYDDPELFREIIMYQEHRIKTFIEKATAHFRIDRLFIWEDMCGKTGPLIGPKMFEEFFLPSYVNVISLAKERGIQFIDVDSDGDITKLIPLWLEAGVTMLHPFEVAAGMDVNKVKSQYKDKLAMRGGVDKRELAKDRRAIDRELHRILPAYDQGGYIPHVDHSVPPDVSLDNYRYYVDKLSKMMGKG